MVDITGARSDWWAEWQALQNMGQAAPFGAATYGAFILPLEAGMRLMFWAISQFVKEMKKIREQHEQQRDEELLKQADATGTITLAGDVQLHVTRVVPSREESSHDAADTRC